MLPGWESGSRNMKHKNSKGQKIVVAFENVDVDCKVEWEFACKLGVGFET